MTSACEILIVGGGPAGLAAALTIGRLDRTALLCDDSRPRNAASSHVNNFPTRDGIHPAQWRAAARKDLAKYSKIELRESTVAAIERRTDDFLAWLSNDETVLAKKIILATGISDEVPAIPGFRELWGKSVFHCVFCHGFEVKRKRLGFLASNEFALRQVQFVQSLASEFVVFTNGSPFSDAARDALLQSQAALIEEDIEEIRHDGSNIEAVILRSGQPVAIDYLFAPPSPPFVMKSPLGDQLGCEKDALGLFKVNEAGQTSIDGVFACGDNCSSRQSVLLASASGNIAGIGALSSLLRERK